MINNNNDKNNIVNNNNNNTKEYKHFIGIDVAKDKFDIYSDIDGKYQTISNKRQYIKNLCNDYLDGLLKKKKLKKDDLLIVIDLTGGYERELVNTFYSEGYTHILLAEGLKVKNFNKSTKYNRAKTDKEDSYVLAEYGKMFYKQLRLYEPINDDRTKITNIFNRIEDYKDQLKRERTRYKAPNIYADSAIKKDIEDNIIAIENKIESLKERIYDIINNNRELKLIHTTLLKEVGIGEETALFLLIRVRELGKIQKRQLASICGLAPVPNDSGTRQGHRYVRGGRVAIRSMMYLCIRNMARFNKETRDRVKFLYNRSENKKKWSSILISLARKKIVITNARVRDTLIENGFLKKEDIR